MVTAPNPSPQRNTVAFGIAAECYEAPSAATFCDEASNRFYYDASRNACYSFYGCPLASGQLGNNFASGEECAYKCNATTVPAVQQAPAPIYINPAPAPPPPVYYVPAPQPQQNVQYVYVPAPAPAPAPAPTQAAPAPFQGGIFSALPVFRSQQPQQTQPSYGYTAPANYNYQPQYYAPAPRTQYAAAPVQYQPYVQPDARYAPAAAVNYRDLPQRAANYPDYTD